jgi:hypothetical protein
MGTKTTILLDIPLSGREDTVSLIVTIPIHPRGTKRGKSKLFGHEWGGRKLGGNGRKTVVPISILPMGVHRR